MFSFYSKTKAFESEYCQGEVKMERTLVFLKRKKKIKFLLYKNYSHQKIEQTQTLQKYLQTAVN